MRLAVQLLLNEEISSLLQVEATVVTHEALGVVELVPSLDDGAPGRDWESSGEVEKRRAGTAFAAASSKTEQVEENSMQGHVRVLSGVLSPPKATTSLQAWLHYTSAGRDAPQLDAKQSLKHLHSVRI